MEFSKNSDYFHIHATIPRNDYPIVQINVRFEIIPINDWNWTIESFHWVIDVYDSRKRLIKAYICTMYYIVLYNNRILYWKHWRFDEMNRWEQ